LFTFGLARHIRGSRRFKRRARLATALGLFAFLCSAALAGLAGAAADKPSPADSAAYGKFLSASTKLYEAVREGDETSAARGLKEIELQLKTLPMRGIATAEGIQALVRNVTDLKRAEASVKRDDGKRMVLAGSLRLAADALAHADKPIWHRYAVVVREDLAKLKTALPERTGITGPAPREAILAFEALNDRYRLVRTAATLRAEPWQIEKTDSAFRYADRIYRADSPSTELLRSTVAPLTEALDGLFPQGKDASAAIVPPLGASPPTWGWSAMMGSFIVAILTWVGWRRYRFEEATGRGRRK